MTVTDIDDFDMVGYLAARFGHESRSPGLHVSQVYGDLDRLLNAKRYSSGISEGELSMFGSIGFVWERILEETLGDITIGSDPARYFRPGEQECDGLLLTPDYADLDFYGDGSNQLGLEEWKVNWKSVNAWNDMEKNFWRWLVQMKAYCYVLGTNSARIRVLFIVGDWRDNITPQCRVREFEFTDQELADNWHMLVQHAAAKGWLQPKGRV